MRAHRSCVKSAMPNVPLRHLLPRQRRRRCGLRLRCNLRLPLRRSRDAQRRLLGGGEAAQVHIFATARHPRLIGLGPAGMVDHASLCWDDARCSPAARSSESRMVIDRRAGLGRVPLNSRRRLSADGTTLSRPPTAATALGHTLALGGEDCHHEHLVARSGASSPLLGLLRPLRTLRRRDHRGVDGRQNVSVGPRNAQKSFARRARHPMERPGTKGLHFSTVGYYHQELKTIRNPSH